MTWQDFLVLWPNNTSDRQAVMLAAIVLLAMGMPLLLFAGQIDALGRSSSAWWWDRPMVNLFRLAAVGAIVLAVFGLYLLVRRPRFYNVTTTRPASAVATVSPRPALPTVTVPSASRSRNHLA